MSDFDVELGEMDNFELSPNEVESLMSGAPKGPAQESTAEFLQDLRAFGANVEAPVVTGALAEFVGVDPTTEKSDMPVLAIGTVYSPEIQAVGLPTSRNRKGKRKMLAGISAFMATVTGKVVVGSTVALASVGGAHAADVIDVPILPDVGREVVEVAGRGDGVAPEAPLENVVVEAPVRVEEAPAEEAPVEEAPAEEVAQEEPVVDATAGETAPERPAADQPADASDAMAALETRMAERTAAIEARAEEQLAVMAERKAALETARDNAVPSEEVRANEEAALAERMADVEARIAEFESQRDERVAQIEARRDAMLAAIEAGEAAPVELDAEIEAARVELRSQIAALRAQIEAADSAEVRQLRVELDALLNELAELHPSNLPARPQTSADGDAQRLEILASIEAQVTEAVASFEEKIAELEAARDEAITAGANTSAGEREIADAEAAMAELEAAVAEIAAEREAALAAARAEFETARAEVLES